jgi:hypothetical protein
MVWVFLRLGDRAIAIVARKAILLLNPGCEPYSGVLPILFNTQGFKKTVVVSGII